MPSPRRRRIVPLRCESLEARITPAFNAFTAPTPLDTVWNIRGTRLDDAVVIQRNPVNPATLIASINGTVVSRHAVAGLKVVNVRSWLGDDNVLLSTNVPRNISFRLHGGVGDDTLTGANGRDRLYGGDGDDLLIGAGGADLLDGGNGDDDFLGGTGADRIVGGEGENEVFGRDLVDRIAPGSNRIYTDPNTNPLDELGSLDELRQWVIDSALKQWGGTFGQKVPTWEWHGGPIVINDPTFVLRGVVAFSANAAITAVADHSGTNNQEAGVEETDVLHTDGNYLYTLSNNALQIIDVRDPENPAIVGSVDIGGPVNAFYLVGDRVVLLNTKWDTGDFEPGPIPILRATDLRIASNSLWYRPFYSKPQTVVRTIDVSDRTAPVITHETTLDGTLADSRVINGRLYTVLQNSLSAPQPEIIDTDDGRYYESQESYVARLEANFTDVLPGYTADDVAGSLIVGANVYVPRKITDSQLLTVAVLDPDQAAPVGVTTTAGTSGTVYASTDNLYVASANWGSWWGDQGPTTQIYKFGLEGDSVPLEGVGCVEGTVLDQFSMDEEGDSFRIATTTNTWSTDSTNSVFVLQDTGDTLDVVGSIRDLGVTETIQSVRFEGDHGYVVTFRRIDPLFTLDLSDPTAPTVVGELKVPGYSAYLQEIGGGRLLGIGRDADENGRPKGLQVSLFDVSDMANPLQLDVEPLNVPEGSWSRGYSNAEWDHHAVAYFPEQGILAVPVTSWEGDQVRTRQHVLRVTATGFEALGSLAVDGHVMTSRRIGDLMVSRSRDQILITKLDDPSVQVASVDLPQLPPPPRIDWVIFPMD